MYRKMTAINTAFSNWLLGFDELQTATSKVLKRYSDEPFPSPIVNQTIRTVKSKKKKQKAKTFCCMWCSFNN
ncbi:hypothetical protein [Pseudogracilibacillus sp. SO30301A]|uniref:hypothetical protein n=1 Tax=Pseudogracilibacillus sp. SO30301A TaxID=3098291 RepID=UPI00300DDCE7